MDIITKQKKISDAASQQLLLDTHILKTILLKLPVFGLENESDINTTTGTVTYCILLLISYTICSYYIWYIYVSYRYVCETSDK